MKKWYCVIIFAVVALDRLAKAWAQRYLPTLAGNTFPLWKDVFQLTYVENRGAAFGMLQNQRLFFIIITVALTLIFLWVLFIRKAPSPMTGVAMSLILGGALGNFYDRLAYGYVVDMFDFRLINFAVFNVADSALCVGAFMWMAVYIIRDLSDAKKKRDNANEADNNA